MINNSRNINKTNHYLSPQIIKHKKTTIYVNGNTDSRMGQASKYDRVKLVNWISTLLLQYIYIETCLNYINLCVNVFLLFLNKQVFRLDRLNLYKDIRYWTKI